MIEILGSVLSGSISSLGMGGGTILILILSSVLGIEQRLAQATNLIFFIPTAISAAIVNWKQKLINKEVIKGVLIGGIVGAIIGSKIAVNLNVNNLKLIFGIFLAVIALTELIHVLKTSIEQAKKSHNKF